MMLMTVYGRACGSTSPSQYMSFRSIGRPTKMSNLRTAKQVTLSKVRLMNFMQACLQCIPSSIWCSSKKN